MSVDETSYMDESVESWTLSNSFEIFSIARFMIYISRHLSKEVYNKLLNLQRKYLLDLRSGKLDNDVDHY